VIAVYTGGRLVKDDAVHGPLRSNRGASGEVSDIEIECSISKVGVGPNEENESVS
jgi:hypothetical protein